LTGSMAEPDPDQAKLDLQRHPALAALFPVKTAPLSVNTLAGIPHRQACLPLSGLRTI
jgi:hypothetical protein